MSKWTKVMRHMMGSRLSNVGFPPRVNQSELDRSNGAFHRRENDRRAAAAKRTRKNPNFGENLQLIAVHHVLRENGRNRSTTRWEHRERGQTARHIMIFSGTAA